MTALARPKPPRMTADEFIAWAMEQPEGERYELVGGRGRGHGARARRACACEGARLQRPGRRHRARRPGVRSVPGRHGRPRSRPTRLRAGRAGPLRPAGAGRHGEDRGSGHRGGGAVAFDRRAATPGPSSAAISGCLRSAITCSWTPENRTVIHHARAGGRRDRDPRSLREGAVRLDPPGDRARRRRAVPGVGAEGRAPHRATPAARCRPPAVPALPRPDRSL